MESDKLLLVTDGEGKAGAFRDTPEDPITTMVQATLVQMRRHAIGIIGKDVSSKLKYEHNEGIVE